MGAGGTVQLKIPDDADLWRGGLDRVDTQRNRQKHIMRWKHAWDLLSDDFRYPTHDGDQQPVDAGAWSFVKTMMLETLWYGNEEAYGRVYKRVHRKWGHTIEVTFNRIDGDVYVSDAWIVADRPDRPPAN